MSGTSNRAATAGLAAATDQAIATVTTDGGLGTVTMGFKEWVELLKAIRTVIGEYPDV